MTKSTQTTPKTESGKKQIKVKAHRKTSKNTPGHRPTSRSLSEARFLRRFMGSTTTESSTSINFGKDSEILSHGITEIPNTFKVIESVRKGLSFNHYDALIDKLGISKQRFNKLLHMNANTVIRRKNAGKFNPVESDQLLRIDRVLSQAVALFEDDEDDAIEWLCQPSSALENEAPLEFLDTEIGARRIEALIEGLEMGEFQ